MLTGACPVLSLLCFSLIHVSQQSYDVDTYCLLFLQLEKLSQSKITWLAQSSRAGVRSEVAWVWMHTFIPRVILPQEGLSSNEQVSGLSKTWSKSKLEARSSHWEGPDTGMLQKHSKRMQCLHPGFSLSFPMHGPD